MATQDFPLFDGKKISFQYSFHYLLAEGGGRKWHL